MTYKKTYVEKYGYEKIVTERNSPLEYLEMDFLKLKKGESHKIDEKNKEFALIILYGSIEVKGDVFSLPRCGKRTSVFSGPAECVYVGKDEPFVVTALDGDAKIAVCKAPALKKFPSRYVPASEIVTKDLGKGNYERKAAFVLPAEVKANLLYIGEFWVEDGYWASYPPHKHDIDYGNESRLDEIYYFEFDKPAGFGFQSIYSKDACIDEVYRVKTGDMVEIPKGYHPFSVAPGYKCYCLWIMAGEKRGIFCSTDPEHSWLNETK